MLPTTSFNKNPLLSFAGIDPNGNGNGGVILLGASEEKGMRINDDVKCNNPQY